MSKLPFSKEKKIFLAITLKTKEKRNRGVEGRKERQGKQLLYHRLRSESFNFGRNRGSTENVMHLGRNICIRYLSFPCDKP